MEENTQTIFRKETIERISSPEKLTDYLQVTSAGVWVVLLAVLVLLTGIFVWAAVGRLETTVSAKVVVQDHTGYVVLNGEAEDLSGKTLRIASKEYLIASSDRDEYGREVGVSEIDLPDGSYDGAVVMETFRAFDFLLESR